VLRAAATHLRVLHAAEHVLQLLLQRLQVLLLALTRPPRALAVGLHAAHAADLVLVQSSHVLHAAAVAAAAAAAAGRGAAAKAVGSRGGRGRDGGAAAAAAAAAAPAAARAACSGRAPAQPWM
jgi:hypothetical protein